MEIKGLNRTEKEILNEMDTELGISDDRDAYLVLGYWLMRIAKALEKANRE